VRGYILAIDQGTTGTRVMIFDREAKVRSRAYRTFTQYYPRPGWVEHDAEEIWETTQQTVKEALEKGGITSREIAAIGITNQRETTVLWRRNSSQPVGRAIVWQCRRSASICEDLRKSGWAPRIQEKTGLVLDAYFSGTKIKWLLENIPGLPIPAEKGEVLFGTIDSWLVWKLTGGEVHLTDYSNASRTMLFNIYQKIWDLELLSLMGIPSTILPEVKSSSEIYGYTSRLAVLEEGIPIAGIAGDQQAALFGQMCFSPGQTKNTYGTGGFLLMNTGNKAIHSPSGLLTTIAWGINKRLEYALEGSVFIAGAVIQWLRDGLGLIKEAHETEELATRVPDNDGVYLVPALVGLGAPYWDMYARGAILGITRGTRKEHIIRAALESIAYQTVDVLYTMIENSGLSLKELRVDGGASENNFLLQFQSDILQVPVIRPRIIETTSLGAAFLAGLAVGFWKSQEEISNKWEVDRQFIPAITSAKRDRLYQRWKKAVERSLRWENSEA